MDWRGNESTYIGICTIKRFHAVSSNYFLVRSPHGFHSSKTQGLIIQSRITLSWIELWITYTCLVEFLLDRNQIQHQFENAIGNRNHPWGFTVANKLCYSHLTINFFLLLGFIHFTQDPSKVLLQIQIREITSKNFRQFNQNRTID